MQTNLALAEAAPTAEQSDIESPHLYVVPDPDSLAPINEVFISADAVPEIAFRRRRVAQEAQRILAYNSQLLHNGRASEVPAASDPLGTAEQVVEARDEFGVDSPEHRRTYKGAVLDNTRLSGEAITKNKKGGSYFERVRRQFVSDDEGHSAHGLSISRMTRNGLSPLLGKEDQARRVNEHVEEDGTYVPIGSMIARHGLRDFVELLPIKIESEIPKLTVQVTTVSECSDEAIAEYVANPNGSHGGMRPGMKAIALRRTHFEDNSGDREDESLIIDGRFITHEVIQAFLVHEGVVESGKQLSKTEVLGTQLVSVNDGSILNFARRLDDFAGTWHGKRFFFGQEVPDDHPRNYGDAIDEAEVRDQQLGSLPVELTDFQIELVDKGTSGEVAEALINKLLKDKFMKVVKQNPELAAVVFDEATAKGLTHVAELEAQGRPEEARLYAQEVYDNAPDVSYCTGGNCPELENVDPHSGIDRLLEDLGLHGKKVRNKVAPCKNCGEKQLHHDYHGNTACTACKSTKLSGQAVRKGQEYNEKKNK